MNLLLSKLNSLSKSVPIEPREIFMTLPQKDKKYEYPRDVQSEVWRKWFSQRDSKNSVIKMNTGSGKTVVGLMILQSCLNEGKGPAVYIVPDNFLVEQVCKEAKKLGISAVTDRDDYLYTENRAILVTTIHSLVNGRSVFGMRSSNNYPIGSVLLDDVHACLETITAQFSIKIHHDHELYREIVSLLADGWKSYNSSSYFDIVENRDPTRTAIIPFWIWQEKIEEIYTLLSKYNTDEDKNQCIFFSLPLLVSDLLTCDCFITSKGVEIIPEGISISKIKSFVEAQRRILMSATLSDDSVLVSAIGLNKEDVTNIITPDNANDIGDRLILFPRHLNNKITNEEIKNKIETIAKNHNVVVIVPSFEKAKFWDENGSKTVRKENIEFTVSALKKQHLGVVVFVNRYDGIDLPDDACRVLVIDGLPPLRNEKDKYIQSIDSSSSILRREQIQRIEQGMGRGVRSNSDSCCIILMGDNLADVLLRNNGVSYFSNATREQYNLSKDLWNLLKEEIPEPTIDDVFELANYSLERQVDWIQMSKERLSSIKYISSPRFDDNSIYLRKAYVFSTLMQWQKMIDMLDEAINRETNQSTKGFLMQIKAKYTNIVDRAKAQQVLMSARSLNTGLLSPLNGIQYDKSMNNIDQSKAICEHISRFVTSPNDYVLYVNSVIEKLIFSDNANEFEAALEDIGKILGFVSSRPDKETNGQGPDNLWAIGNAKYLVIECKSAATADTISKNYCNQLGGSIRWFECEYGSEFTAIPIMVHKTTVVDEAATIVPNMRIITVEKLDVLKKNINEFAAAMSQPYNWLDESKITGLIRQYRLRSTDFCAEYTLPYIKN